MAYKQLSPIIVAEGGTGATTLTDHAVLVGSGTGAISFVGPVAATGAFLASNGVGSDPGFSTATYPLTTTANELLYSSSTNTVAGLTTANSGVLTTNSSGVPAVTAIANDGEIIIGSTAGSPAAGNITSTGATITVTNGSNTINLEAVATGDVSGPGSSTDNALARWNGTGGDTLQDSTVIVTDNGEMTNASQPAFYAYLGTSDLNETGDATTFILGDTDVGTALTDIYDQNSDFTTGASGGAFFTAPVVGKYLFNMSWLLGGITASHTSFEVTWVTSNRNYTGGQGNSANFANSGANIAWPTSQQADMDAMDTCMVQIAVSGGTKVVDILTAGTDGTSFAGFLIC